MFIITKTQLSDGFLNDLDETLILQTGQFLREIFLVGADFFFFLLLPTWEQVWKMGESLLHMHHS